MPISDPLSHHCPHFSCWIRHRSKEQEILNCGGRFLAGSSPGRESMGSHGMYLDIIGIQWDTKNKFNVPILIGDYENMF